MEKNKPQETTPSKIINDKNLHPKVREAIKKTLSENAEIKGLILCENQGTNKFRGVKSLCTFGKGGNFPDLETALKALINIPEKTPLYWGKL